MPLVEDNHMVETLTSNGADHPFDKWILPRGARCGKDLLYPETVDASVEVRSVGLVSIPYQVPRRCIPWKSIDLCLLFIHPRAPNLINLRSAGTMPA